MNRKVVLLMGMLAITGIITGMAFASAARSSVTINVGGGGAKGAVDVLHFSPGQVAISEGGSVTYQWVSSFHAVVLEKGNCADSWVGRLDGVGGPSPDFGCTEDDDILICTPRAAEPGVPNCTPEEISALAAGMYEYYCPIGDHHLKGMDGKIKILP